ncbi:TPA: hypothetical protein ACGOYL_000291 [Streptococcus suis]|nr:hypothetical protein [Streptococcus suis]
MESFKIEFEADSDGYFTYECPFCEEQFKLLASEVQDGDFELEELFCPYCGLVDDANKFYSKEVLAYIHNLAEEWVIGALNKSFGSIKSSKNFRVNFKKIKHNSIAKPSEIDSVEEMFTCEMCGKHEKVLFSAGDAKVFCAYCGGDL